MPGTSIQIRSGPRHATLEEWALVLTAERIPSRIVPLRDAQGRPAGFGLEVPPEAAERAETTLRAWEEENAVDRPAPPPELHGPGSVAGLAVATLLLCLHAAFTLGPWPASFWLERGSAEARAILDGALWRTVTALTLHADLGHVIGNAIAVTFFGNAAARALGPGLLLAALVVAGAGGNLANAVHEGPPHDSIGASTAVFATLGLLCGRALRVGRWSTAAGPRRLAPIGAGLAVLAMIGVGGLRTDIGAHVFGLAVGTATGFALALATAQRPPPALQAVLGLAALAVVIASWTLALRTA